MGVNEGLSKMIFYTDRTAAELDDKCGMAFWWNRKHEGTGIVAATDAEALMVGGQVHEDLVWVAETPELTLEALQRRVEEIKAQTLINSQEDMEVLYRRLGWLCAYALYIEPIVRAKYETIHIEGELILDRTPLWVAVTPDRVLRDKESGILVYREYKTTISASKKWLDSWKYAIQLHIGMQAIAEELEEKVSYAQIMGLMKGNYASDDRLNHPYSWGYSNGTSWSASYADGRKSGWEPKPVWEYEQGIVKWVQFVGEEEAISQFPHTEPVFLNPRLLESWIRRRVYRESQIAHMSPQASQDHLTREVYFPRRQSQCRPAFGDACPYLLACWNAEVERDPLKHPDYKVRVPHHQIENQVKEAK